MMRAEMVLRGHLSREQYEGLNAWASWYMGEEYPDPLARIDKKFNGAEARGIADCGLRDAEWAGDEARGPGEAVGASGGQRANERPWESPVPHTAPSTPHSIPGTPHSIPGTPHSIPGTPHSISGTPYSVPGTELLAASRASGVREHPDGATEREIDVAEEERRHREADASRSPTRIERRLASGRRMSPVERRRLEG